MAWKDNNRKRKRTKTRKSRKSNYSQLEKFAFKIGLVQRGLENPNSKVYESFNNAKSGKSKSNKKPLI